MSLRFVHHGWLSLVLASAAISPVVAQVQVKRAQVKVQVEAINVDIGDAVEELAAQPVFMFANENFDQWLYRDLQNAAGARSRLDALLLLRLDNIVQACSLSDPQRQKLQLAGRGDINRFFEHIEELHRKFQLVKTDQNRIGEILQEMQPLQMLFQVGLFGDASMFEDSEKHAHFRAAGRIRNSRPRAPPVSLPGLRRVAGGEAR